MVGLKREATLGAPSGPNVITQATCMWEKRSKVSIKSDTLGENADSTFEVRREPDAVEGRQPAPGS